MSRLPPETQRFREAALRFCRVVDEAPALERLAFLESAAAALAELYHAGFALGVAHFSPEDPLESLTTGPLPSYQDVAGRLAAVLGRHDLYWQLFAPTDKDPPIQQVLSDDLANVYLDVLEGLVALDAGAPEGDVEGEWRIGFESHWGPHAVKALRALHYLLYAH